MRANLGYLNLLLLEHRPSLTALLEEEFSKMFAKVAVFCLVSLAAAQYKPQYEAAAYAKPYDSAYEEKPEPYAFGYDVKDEYGATLNRKEESDDYGNKKGSYGYTDPYGIYRQVDYVADENGFRAVIKTNEPGTESQNPSGVELLSSVEPTKYDAPATYEKAPAYALAKPYGAPAPSYKPAPVVYAPAPAAYASAPVYKPSPALAYQQVAPKAYAAPEYQLPAHKSYPVPEYQPSAPKAYAAPAYHPSAPAPYDVSKYPAPEAYAPQEYAPSEPKAYLPSAYQHEIPAYQPPVYEESQSGHYNGPSADSHAPY